MRLFSARSDGGRVNMPYEKTFWSPGFAMLVDRFGTPWMINGDA
jgi:PhnB protein